MAASESRPDTAVELPAAEAGPLRKIASRLLIAVGLITLVALTAYLGRDGFEDPEDGTISILDAFYYSTVSVTTTGYGDIVPVTDSARLLTTVIATPARVLFLILLVGTTLEILAERTRIAYRIGRWRKSLKDHIIVCGYGTKGRSAIRTLLGKGFELGQIVVIDERSDARRRATAAGLASVAGSATGQEALEEAGIRDARAVIVGVDRDDSAVLITLTARELAPQATIVVAVREEENSHLLHQSGADSVIVSSGAAGRLLGLASDTPAITEVLEDLLSVGEGLDITEHAVAPEDVGPLTALNEPGLVVAVIRDGEVLRFDDERASELKTGDRVVTLCSHEE